MTPTLLHVYESLACYRALHGRNPTLAQLARACGLRRWECYCRVVGLRRRGLMK